MVLALWSLGNLLDRTQPEIAFEYFKKAADLGQWQSEVIVGNCYSQGRRWVAPTFDLAWKYLKSAADKGEAKAQFEFAYFLHTCENSKKYVEEKMDYLKRSLKKDYAPAQYLMGYFYENGIELPQNDQEAFCLYSLAAKQKNRLTLFRLGICYEEEKERKFRMRRHFAVMTWLRISVDLRF